MPCGLTILAVALVACPEAARGPASHAPLEKLYVIQVFDTDDEALRTGLDLDQKRMTSLWTFSLPPKRREILTLTGDAVSPGRISRAIRALRGKITSRDSLVFYYAGQGALAKKGGRAAHSLRLASGQDVGRASLRQLLESLKAGLTVLLTDCRATQEKSVVAENRPGIPRCVPPHVESLFLRQRGVVDLTAAADEEGWSDDVSGGLFTRTFCGLLMRGKIKGPGGNDEDEGGVTWEQLFPLLQKETQTYFRWWPASMRARYGAPVIRAETQKPHAFFLGKSKPLAYNAVELENKRDTALVYKFRWKGDEEWVEFKLEPGKSFCHFRPAKPDGETVPLEILREGATKEDTLKARLWDKDTAPRLDFKYAISGPKK